MIVRAAAIVLSSLILFAATGCGPRGKVWSPDYPAVLGVRFQSSGDDVRNSLGEPATIATETKRAADLRRSWTVEPASGARGEIWMYHLHDGRLKLSVTLVDDRVVAIVFEGVDPVAADPWGVVLGRSVPLRAPSRANGADYEMNYGLYIAAHYAVVCCTDFPVSAVNLTVPEKLQPDVRLAPQSGDGTDPRRPIVPAALEGESMLDFERAYLDLTPCAGTGRLNVRTIKPARIGAGGRVLDAWEAFCSQDAGEQRIYFSTR